MGIQKTSINNRIFILCFCWIFMFKMTACGIQDTDAERINKISEESKESYEDYYLSYLGIDIIINDNYEKIREKLEEPIYVYEVPLCGMEGKDVMYEFGHFEIDVFETGEKNDIYSVVFKDDLISTREGVYIGCTVDNVMEIYGNKCEERNGSIVIHGQTMDLVFLIQDELIKSIQYISTVQDI